MAIPLYLNSSDLDSISLVIREAVDKVSHAFDKSREIDIPNAISPHLISKALQQFLEALYRVDYDLNLSSKSSDQYALVQDYMATDKLSSKEITEIGDHGLQLLNNLCEWAQALKLPYQHSQVRAIMVMVSLWVARHGGEINSIDSVVNTLAEIANSTDEQEALAELSFMMGELINAVSTSSRYDFDNSNRGHPWRVLNFNRGIIATRSHDTRIMEHAFEDLIRNIPEDAERFFQQGMQQMEELNYPDHVRKVVSKYYDQSKSRVLH